MTQKNNFTIPRTFFENHSMPTQKLSTIGPSQIMFIDVYQLSYFYSLFSCVSDTRTIFLHYKSGHLRKRRVKSATYYYFVCLCPFTTHITNAHVKDIEMETLFLSFISNTATNPLFYNNKIYPVDVIFCCTLCECLCV